MSNYPFRPVRTTEDKLESLDTVNGYLYFTTDTGKIFLGQENEKIEMCSNKGFYYGKLDIEYDGSGNTPDPIVEFSKDDIEDGGTPEVDDLILNMDGCFYRVTAVSDDKESFTTTRLTLQGTGTGSGGGGTGSASFAISPVSKTCYFSTEATEAKIGFKATSSEADNYIAEIAWGFGKNTTEYEEELYNLSYPVGEYYYIDLIKYLDIFEPNLATYVTVKVKDQHGTERTLIYTIYSVELSLTKTSDDLLTLTDDEAVQYTVLLSGSTLSDKKITYDFYLGDSVTPAYSLTQPLADTYKGSIT